jgi:hypothetical protein
MYQFVEGVVGMKNLLVNLLGAFAGAMLAALFSIRVFGINSGWMYIVFIIALAILGARIARVVYARAIKGK